MKITDKMRLDRCLKFLNSDPVISNCGNRVFSRVSIDCLIREENLEWAKNNCGYKAAAIRAGERNKI